MNRDTYTNQDIIAYLLGSLPEAEAERFDELNFTDNEFADMLKSAEKDLIDAFVNGELTGTTLENFKSHYLISPLRREKVNFADAFQAFAGQQIAKENENSAVRKAKPKRNPVGFFSSLNIFTNENLLLRWSFAVAALLLVVSSVFWIVNNRDGQQIESAKKDTPINGERDLSAGTEEQLSENSNAEREIAAANKNNNLPRQNSGNEQAKNRPVSEPITNKQQSQPISPKISLSFILAPSLRGDSRIQSLSISEAVTDVALQLQLESDDYPAYKVVLTSPTSNKNIWQSKSLKPNGKGESKTLNLSIPSKLLKSQTYSLQVSGVSAGAIEIISDYPFKVVR
jgi:cell division protein FtsL